MAIIKELYEFVKPDLIKLHYCGSVIGVADRISTHGDVTLYLNDEEFIMAKSYYDEWMDWQKTLEKQYNEVWDDECGTKCKITASRIISPIRTIQVKFGDRLVNLHRCFFKELGENNTAKIGVSFYEYL